MTVASGTRLGPYEVLSSLGAGGMGEVYRAKDVRVDRAVALKVLPEEFFEGEERRARFEREARMLASLNHPGIAVLYSFEEIPSSSSPSSSTRHLLVMELVEGEDLAVRIAAGPLPLEESLSYARQIAEALEAAHEKGIVHRDLKPANVKVTPEGRVKLLDFGLAKIFEADGGSVSSPSATHSPTLDARATEAGVILGTAAYMSPEQARGKPLDKRTDVWAFGCVLYEMLTGRRAFEGETVSDTLAAILTKDPDWAALPERTPGRIKDLLRRCLRREAKQRLHDIADARLDLEELGGPAGASGQLPFEEKTAAPSPTVASAEQASRERRNKKYLFLAWAIAAALAAAAGTFGFLALHPRTSGPAPLVRSSLLAPDGVELVSTSLSAGPVEVSPDGSRLVFVARRGEEPSRLWVRDLSEPTARPLAGTEDANRPFWSADGRFIGYFTTNALRKVPARGGASFTLARTSEARGGTWSETGVILYTPNVTGPVYRVSAEGGSATPVTPPDDVATTHRYPHLLPDGRHFLYLVRRSVAGSGVGAEIRVGTLDSKESKAVVRASSNAVYSAGYLLYAREGALVAQPFDLKSLEMRGEPVVIVQEIKVDERFSRAVFSASPNGTLVYETGKGQAESVLSWIDRTGKVLGTLGDPAQYFNGGQPEIAPDGRRATASILDLRTGQADIWMIDLATGTRSRFTTGPLDKFLAVWSPDGRKIAFGGSGRTIEERDVAGAGEPERLVAPDKGMNIVPCGYSRDGQSLLYSATEEGRADIWTLSLRGERRVRPFAAAPASERLAQPSPDGHWVAYQSDESGRWEIVVAPFPGPGPPRPVSQEGGVEPRWSHDGKELYFFAPDNRLMAASVRAEASGFEVGAIVPLFVARRPGLVWRYDVARDGRFLVNRDLPQPASPISLVLNWPRLLGK